LEVDAKRKKEMEAYVQNNASCLVYYDKKLELMNLCGSLTAESKLIEMKSGLKAEVQMKVLWTKSLPELRSALKEIDEINQKEKGQEKDMLIAQTVCWKCNKPGHMKKDCRVKKIGNFPPCQHCKKTNHSSDRCWSLNPSKKKENLNVLQGTDDNKDFSKCPGNEQIFTAGNSMPWSRISVYGTNLSGYWDSGASISGMDQNFFRNHFSRFTLNDNDVPDIRIANNDVFKPLGSVRLPVKFDGSLEKFVKNIKFYIIPNLPKRCILGMNVMCLGKFDFVNRVASLDNCQFPLANEVYEASLYSAQNVEISPGKLAELYVRVDGPKTYLVKDDKKSPFGIVDGRNIDSSTDWILVYNRSDRPIKFARDEKLDIPLVDEETLHFVDMVNVTPVDPKEDNEVDYEINMGAPLEAREMLIKKIKEIKMKLRSKEWGTTAIEHKLKLKEEFVNRCNAYVYGPKENGFISDTTKEMLGRGICRPSNAVNVSPVVVAKHPRTKKLRFCVNYQKLNAASQKEFHRMPKIWNILQKMISSNWFSSLDLQSGFWQVPMHPDSVPLTAFITNEGIFEMLFMPFGLLNASFTFQEMMDRILAGSAALPYIDDCPIHSAGSALDHVRAVSEVLERLVDNNLRPNWSKCKFLFQKLDLLGHVVSEGKVEIDPKRLERLKNMPDPTNVKEVHMFLGLCAVYYKFIPKFQMVAEPLFI
jgi:hypothetical protein